METEKLAAKSAGYFIAAVGEESLAFPTQLIADILTVERSQILHLPFYPPMFLGVIQAQSQIVPLILAPKIISKELNKPLPLIVTVVRLNRLAQQLAGVGIVVDRMAGSTSELDSQHRKFEIAEVPTHIWQPQL